MVKVGIDLMGGDRPPESLFKAIQQAALESKLSFVVYANKETYQAVKEEAESLSDRVQFILSPEVITMQDDPLQAIRRKKKSSLVQGIRALKKKEIAALVSIGNTGALLACATLTLPLLPEVKRPALAALLPVEKGNVAVLDVGGTVQCKAAHLVRFAKLGASFKRVKDAIQVPRVGLLNIGGESKKGTAEHRLAYEMLEKMAHHEHAFQFIGNVEGRDVFQGKADVVVTDGFTGNVLLKTAEGMALFMLDHFKRKFSSHSAWRDIQKRFSYTEYPGAILLGVEGVVMKCHGDASTGTLLKGIQEACAQAQGRFIERFKKDYLR
jgi:glycerol-3-phosphate acyltransferase PlsX